jgi:hypothetical protein
MDLGPAGWHHLDYDDYGDDQLSNEDFAKRHRDRHPAKVVSREMIETASPGIGERLKEP